MDYTFSGTYTRDLLRLSGGVAKQAARWFQIFRWAMLGILLIGALSITYFSMNNLTPAYMDTLRIAIWVLLFIYFGMRFALSGKKQADEQWEKIKDAPEVEGKVSMFGVTLEYPGFQQSTPWSEIKEAVKVRGLTVLTKNDGSFIPIPMSFAKDQATWGDMQKFMSEQIRMHH